MQIPEIKNYNEDALMMVKNDSRYGKEVPFANGTIHIHAALMAMTEDEWENMTHVLAECSSASFCLQSFMDGGFQFK